MKTDFMPLGFQFSPQPDQGCDLPDCIILEDTPWKIFEGCWHSFHLSCLDVVDVCPICRTGIETAMKSLATIANKYALPRENTGGGDNTGGIETAAGNDDDENDDDANNDDNDDELLTSSVNANVDQILQNLTLQIMALSVRPPPVQPVDQHIIITITSTSVFFPAEASPL